PARRMRPFSPTRGQLSRGRARGPMGRRNATDFAVFTDACPGRKLIDGLPGRRREIRSRLAGIAAMINRGPSAAGAFRSLPGSVTVAQEILVLFVLVRIQAG